MGERLDQLVARFIKEELIYKVKLSISLSLAHRQAKFVNNFETQIRTQVYSHSMSRENVTSFREMPYGMYFRGQK